MTPEAVKEKYDGLKRQFRSGTVLRDGYGALGVVLATNAVGRMEYAVSSEGWWADLTVLSSGGVHRWKWYVEYLHVL